MVNKKKKVKQRRSHETEQFRQRCTSFSLRQQIMFAINSNNMFIVISLFITFESLNKHTIIIVDINHQIN